MAIDYYGGAIMKKVFSVLVLVLIVAIMACSFMACTSSADYEIKNINDYDLSEMAYGFLNDISTNYANRTIGSAESKLFIEYVSTRMTNLGYSVSTQEFTVVSQNKTTKNIICKKAKEGAKKTIIIGCQWDNNYDLLQGNPDGAYESGAAIASLTLIAEKMATVDLDYNLEIVFFGAGAYNWAGAKHYVKELSAEQKSNIALMINLSFLGAGDNIYMYSRDKAVNYNDYFYAVANKANLAISAVPQDKRIISTSLDSDSIYEYSHFGMFGNNYYFMNELIPSVSYISFNWTDKSIPAWVELSGKSNVYGTSDDTFENMIKRVGKDNIVKNLNTVVNSVLGTIVDQGNLLELDAFKNPDEVNAFARSNEAYYIFSIAFKVLIVGLIIAVVVFSRNYIRKHKEQYVIFVPKMDMKDIVEEDIFGMKPEEPKQNKEDKNDDINEDDVFQ